MILGDLSLVGACFLSIPLSHGKVRNKQESLNILMNLTTMHVMFVACSEIIWLCGLLVKFGFSETEPTSLYADNTTVIQIVENLVFHEHTEHIEVFL